MKMFCSELVCRIIIGNYGPLVIGSMNNYKYLYTIISGK